ncbi:hypothetical protein ACFL43_02565 [Thermodesulfobacteriota bacterium]
MTVTEMQKRNQRAEQLQVYQTDHEDFWVESSDSRIAYRCYFNMERGVGKCTCPDYQTRVKSDGDFKCKHLLAVADAVINHDTEVAARIEKSKPKLDDRFISNIQGKDFVVYSGLLDLAHQRGLVKLEVKTLQLPSKDNGFEAICHAVAESKYGEVFSDVGDANPKNVNSKIAAHIIRMASTRAKARCLRDMTSIGITCLEELGDLDEIAGGNGKVVDIKSRKAAQPRKPQAAKPAPAANNNNGNGSGRTQAAKPVAAKPKPVARKPAPPAKPKQDIPVNQPKMSQAQNRALMNLSRRRGVSIEELARMTEEAFNSDVEHLSSQDAASLIRQLQTAS